MEQKHKLTDKQKAFCDEYLISLDATQAAIKAGYSPKTAGQLGYQLLQKTSVQAQLHRRMKKREERTEITQDMIVRELAAVGFARATDYAAVDGPIVTIKPTAELTAEQQKAIASIEQGNFGVKLKLYNKIKALELLGKHLGMFADKAMTEDDDETGVALLPPVLDKAKDG